MKTKSILAVMAALPLALVSCSKDNPEAAGGGPDADSPAGTSNGYPLTTCVVSGERLGSMGEPFEHVYEGTTVKFCCKSCLPEFEEDPEEFVAKLKE